MDIKCTHCGEPFDQDELHEMGMAYEEAVRLYQKYGCGLVEWAWNGGRDAGEGIQPCSSQVVDKEGAELAQACYQVHGDDMDASAAVIGGGF